MATKTWLNVLQMFGQDNPTQRGQKNNRKNNRKNNTKTSESKRRTVFQTRPLNKLENRYTGKPFEDRSNENNTYYKNLKTISNKEYANKRAELVRRLYAMEGLSHRGVSRINSSRRNTNGPRRIKD